MPKEKRKKQQCNRKSNKARTTKSKADDMLASFEGLVVIDPPYAGDRQKLTKTQQFGLNLLEEMGERLQDKNLFERLIKSAKSDPDTMEMIQAWRLELFFEQKDRNDNDSDVASNKAEATSTNIDDLDTIIALALTALKDKNISKQALALRSKKVSTDEIEKGKRALKDYCIYQAMRDPRLEGTQMEFGTFLVILTYGPATAQTPHVDLTASQHQFGVMVTKNSSPTIWYRTRTPIEGPIDLKHVWYYVSGGKEVPKKLMKLLGNNQAARERIEKYGPVLHLSENMTREQPVHLLGGGQLRQTEALTLSPGAVMSLKGRVIHRGPAHDNPTSPARAVLFFTGYNKNAKEKDDDNQVEFGSNGESGEKEADIYNTDTQFTSATLCAQLIYDLWLEMDSTSRRYMLHLWCEYTRDLLKPENSPWDWASHVGNKEPKADPMRDCLKKIQDMIQRNGNITNQVEELIDSMIGNNDLVDRPAVADGSQKEPTDGNWGDAGISGGHVEDELDDESDASSCKTYLDCTSADQGL